MSIQEVFSRKGEHSGYRVRCGAKPNGGWKFVKTVPIRKYPTVEEAHNAAIECEKQFKGLIPPKKKLFNGEITARNKSGVPGIRYDKRAHNRNEAICCHQYVDGKLSRFSFSVEKYGLDGALLLAMEKRGIADSDLDKVKKAMGLR